MKPKSAVRFGLALAWGAFWAVDLQAALLTIDQAVALSERTGRPIFAVAGNAT